jgi:hypothetical protein
MGNGLMLDITGRTGFAALNQDLVGIGTIIANGITVDGTTKPAQNTIGLEQAIRSNAANVVISNLVISNLFGSNGMGNVGVTNFPTNFPDAAAIGLLGRLRPIRPGPTGLTRTWTRWPPADRIEYRRASGLHQFGSAVVFNQSFRHCGLRQQHAGRSHQFVVAGLRAKRLDGSPSGDGGRVAW